MTEDLDLHVGPFEGCVQFMKLCSFLSDGLQRACQRYHHLRENLPIVKL